MRQKTTQPKFFDKLKIGAAAFAVALPLCTGCMNKETIKPVQQPTQAAATVSQPASAPKRNTTAKDMEGMPDLRFPTVKAAPSEREDEPITEYEPIAPSSRPASASERPFLIMCTRDSPAFARNVRPDFKKTYSVRQGISTLYITGHGSEIILSISRVTEKGVALEDLVNRRIISIRYGNETKVRGREIVAYIKVEHGEGEDVVNLSITKIGLTCDHPVSPSFDVLCAGLKKQASVIRANEEINIGVTAPKFVTVSGINNRGIELAEIGLLRYGREMRLGEFSAVTIKAERGTEKGTAMITVVSPDTTRIPRMFKMKSGK